MIYHVLPGDAQVEGFLQTGIEGEVIVFREALVTGPINAKDINDFWDQRARFILGEYGDDEIAYQEKVADEILRLGGMSGEDEVNLWFEFELFCSVNLWYCLNEIKDSEASIYRVAPVNLEPDEVWKGFGGHGPDELRAAFESRIEMSDEDVSTGAELWRAYREGDQSALLSLGQHRSSTFPFLKEVTEAAAEIDSRPRKIIAEIKSEGLTTIAEVFPEFNSRAGVYGFGDLQVERLMS